MINLFENFLSLLQQKAEKEGIVVVLVNSAYCWHFSETDLIAANNLFLKGRC